MVLDNDLLRNVLLFLEERDYYIENSDGDVETNPVWFEQMAEHFSYCGRARLFYTLKNLEQAGYISLSTHFASNVVDGCCINYITFHGHEFLASIKDKDRWKGIKKALPAIKNYSIEAINAVAQGMTAAAISSYCQTNH